MKHLSLSVLAVLIYVAVFAQDIRNEDLVYDENIHSVQLQRIDDRLSNPIIRLGTNDRLRLSFDDMSSETYLFRYTFIHCDHEWNESGLDQFDYLEGFFEDEINNYEFSVNAIPSYIHYELTFPRSDMQFRISGNYILKVYLNNTDDENVLFTRRFFVIESLTNIAVSIPYYPKVLSYTRYKQQVDLELMTPDLFSGEPVKRINVVIQQNGRWDNAKVGLKPTSVTANTLGYYYPNGIVFDGGNSFRHFNMESFWYKSMYIREIYNEADGYSVVLHTNAPRAGQEFETIVDMHGRRIIQARKDQNTSTEGEYAWVHFSLRTPVIRDADIYILGQLNDWQLNEKSRMVYDNDTRTYYGKLYLKQGYYEYLYAVVPKGKREGDVTLIEGDFWQANNEYTVYVYYRERMPDYDRLIGYFNAPADELKQ